MSDFLQGKIRERIKKDPKIGERFPIATITEESESIASKILKPEKENTLLSRLIQHILSNDLTEGKKKELESAIVEFATASRQAAEGFISAAVPGGPHCYQ